MPKTEKAEDSEFELSDRSLPNDQGGLIPSLPIDAELVRVLAVKVRAFMGKEAGEVPNVASNFTDDDMPPASFQEQKNDPMRQETRDNIRGLGRDQQAALIALMWIGRGDGQLDDWPELMREAMNRLDHPADMYPFRPPAAS